MVLFNDLSSIRSWLNILLAQLISKLSSQSYWFSYNVCWFPLVEEVGKLNYVWPHYS